jgi:uncharacterized membrane protein YgdD (TMEM256/DUF423 family)
VLKENNLPKQLLLIGISGAISVSLGALGAHGLKNKLQTGLISPDQLNGFDTAVKYQVYHTLAMLGVAILKLNFSNKYLNWAYNLFFYGVILFSGSLYFLCTRNLFGADWLKFLGPVTPIGGMLFVLGWICLSISAIKK